MVNCFLRELSNSQTRKAKVKESFPSFTRLLVVVLRVCAQRQQTRAGPAADGSCRQCIVVVVVVVVVVGLVWFGLVVLCCSLLVACCLLLVACFLLSVNLPLGVEMTLLSKVLTVVRPAVLVLMLPSEWTQSLPTVKRT